MVQTRRNNFLLDQTALAKPHLPMILCSNCESAAATVRCCECSFNDSLFCRACSDIHLKVKKFRSHCFDMMASDLLCWNCENSPAENICSDCPYEENSFCRSCSDIHIKVKSTRQHRIKKIAATASPKRGAISTRMMEIPMKGTMENAEISNALTDSCSDSPVYYWNYFLLRGPVLVRSSFILNAYEGFINLMDISEFFDILEFFDFGVILNEIQLPTVIIPAVCLFGLICLFSGDMITTSGSSIAIIVGVIAFLRFMQFRKEVKVKHGPKHPNRNKRHMGVRSRHTVPSAHSRSHYLNNQEPKNKVLFSSIFHTSSRQVSVIFLKSDVLIYLFCDIDIN